MLQLGIRGHDMPQADFESWVTSIKDAGFCCIQLALRKAVIDFPTDTAALTPGMALYMKKVFSKNQVDVAVLGCYQNLTTPDLGQWDSIRKDYEAHLRFASFLGCGMVGTETGAVNAAYAYEEANRSKEALDRLVERLKPLAETAEKMGVILGIEPVCRHIMWNIERTRAVLDRVSSPNLRVIYDPVNLLDISNYEKQDEIMKEAFLVIGSEIDVIHIKDFIVKEGSLITSPLALGDGYMNFQLLFQLIKSKKPCIHMLIEDSFPDNIQKTKAYVENIYAKA